TSLSPLDSAGAATVESTAMAVTLAFAQDGRIIPSALGGQLLGDPALARAREPDAFVQAVVAVLPELDRVRLEHVAAPSFGPGDLVPGQEPLELGLELVAACDRLALPRGGGRCPRARGASRPVRVRLLLRKPSHRSLDPYLPTELPPVEDERRARVLGQLAALAALVAGEEGEAALVGALQQQHPRG